MGCGGSKDKDKKENKKDKEDKTSKQQKESPKQHEEEPKAEHDSAAQDHDEYHEIGSHGSHPKEEEEHAEKAPSQEGDEMQEADGNAQAVDEAEAEAEAEEAEEHEERAMEPDYEQVSAPVGEQTIAAPIDLHGVDSSVSQEVQKPHEEEEALSEGPPGQEETQPHAAAAPEEQEEVQDRQASLSPLPLEQGGYSPAREDVEYSPRGTTVREPTTPRRAVPEEVKERKNVRVSEAREEGLLAEDENVECHTPRIVKTRPERLRKVERRPPPPENDAGVPQQQQQQQPNAYANPQEEDEPRDHSPDAAAYPASMQPHQLNLSQLQERSEGSQLHSARSASSGSRFAPESVLYAGENPNDASYVDPNDDPNTPRGRAFSQEAEDYKRLHGQLQEAQDQPEWKVLRPQPAPATGGWAMLRQVRTVFQLQNMTAM